MIIDTQLIHKGKRLRYRIELTGLELFSAKEQAAFIKSAKRLCAARVFGAWLAEQQENKRNE